MQEKRAKTTKRARINAVVRRLERQAEERAEEVRKRTSQLTPAELRTLAEADILDIWGPQ